MIPHIGDDIFHVIDLLELGELIQGMSVRDQQAKARDIAVEVPQSDAFPSGTINDMAACYIVKVFA